LQAGKSTFSVRGEFLVLVESRIASGHRGAVKTLIEAIGVGAEASWASAAAEYRSGDMKFKGTERDTGFGDMKPKRGEMKKPTEQKAASRRGPAQGSRGAAGKDFAALESVIREVHSQRPSE